MLIGIPTGSVPAMAAFDRVRQLFPGIKTLFGATTVYEVRGTLGLGGFAHIFKHLIASKIEDDLEDLRNHEGGIGRLEGVQFLHGVLNVDNATIHTIQHSAQLALENQDVRNETYRSVVGDLLHSSVHRRLGALVFHIAKFISNDATTPEMAAFAAWIVVEFMLSWYRYSTMVDNPNCWSDFRDIDEE